MARPKSTNRQSAIAALQKAREDSGLSQEKVAEFLSIGRERYAKWESRTPVPMEFIAPLAELLKVNPQALLAMPLPQIVPPAPAAEEELLPKSNVSPVPMPGKLDPFKTKPVPLLGMAQGGSDGSFILNMGEPLAQLERPIGLAGKDRIYALRVDGNSMSPIHEDGDLLFVDPGRKAFAGRDAVIEFYPDNDFEHQTRALLKRIVKLNGEFIIAKEWQPKEREFRIPRSKIKALHLVLKNNEMY